MLYVAVMSCHLAVVRCCCMLLSCLQLGEALGDIGCSDPEDEGEEEEEEDEDPADAAAKSEHTGMV